ncbi:hypothetical protein M9H77_05020 [Catharanthus roseus]|uniref:Uncharacterized protein n=1 Tax=Catharanthus roseus TaxID=4058 RepID=A0ACC0CG16_CATRO|nr:hypothetical protein M9H77_05020 [Catharanthus roseus]
MIGSINRVRNLKRGHQTQVPASRSQYQPETQSTLYERSIFRKPPHTPLIHKIESSPYHRSKPTKYIVRKRPSYRRLATHSAILSTY